MKGAMEKKVLQLMQELDVKHKVLKSSYSACYDK